MTEQVVTDGFLLALYLMDFHAYLSIDLGTRHLLKQGRFVGLIAVQELGKPSLSQHNRAEELIQSQSDEFLDIFFNLGLFSLIDRISSDAIISLDDTFWPDDVAVGFHAGTVNMPSSRVGNAVVVVKGE